jgi:peroxiredoxin
MYKTPLAVLILLALLNCKEQQPKSVLKEGNYRATLEVKDGELLPFIFKVLDSSHIEIYNAKEVIEVNEITYKGDSVFIQPPVFEGVIAAKINSNGDLKGRFINEDKERVLAFKAEFGNKERFKSKGSITDVSGVWEVVFSPGIANEEYIAKGIFSQNGNIVNGTFRTLTGDYRFLEGVIDADIMKLSAFDGAHSFLFTAEINDSVMNGWFYSDNHWKEPFRGVRNSSYELPNADDLTFLKKGYDRIEFEFPDTEGQMLSLDDERFQNKVVVVQIMGTWCPNCMDESKYLSEYYRNREGKDLEIVALAFEYAKTQEKAFNRIKRLKKQLNIEYPVLLAQYGTSSKSKANEKLPMLNHILSYPTSIFIDKQGRVRKIHTGFNGPATGDKFLVFKADFEDFIADLLAE